MKLRITQFAKNVCPMYTKEEFLSKDNGHPAAAQFLKLSTLKTRLMQTNYLEVWKHFKRYVNSKEISTIFLRIV